MGGALGFSDTFVASVIGHTLGTVTSRYTHKVNPIIVQVADSISQEIESALARGAARQVKIKVPKYKGV